MWGLNFKMISIQGLSVNAKFVVCMYYVHTCGHRGFSMLKTSHYIPNLNPSEFSHDYLSTTIASSFSSNCLDGYLSKLVTTTSTFMVVMSSS